MTVLSLVLLTALLGCQPAQYLAIPGAYVDTTSSDAVVTTGQSIGVSVAAGDPALTVGSSVTFHVDLTVVTDLVVTDVTLVTVPSADLWTYPVSEEELAAGGVDLEIQATDQKPDDPGCDVVTRYGQHGWCAAPMESGVTSAVGWAVNDTQSTTGAPLPFTLAPSDPGDTPDSCASFTYADCCPNGGAVQCAVDPACGCPDGTGGGAIGGDGYRQCTC